MEYQCSINTVLNMGINAEYHYVLITCVNSESMEHQCSINTVLDTASMQHQLCIIISFSDHGRQTHTRRGICEVVPYSEGTQGEIATSSFRSPSEQSRGNGGT